MSNRRMAAAYDQIAPAFAAMHATMPANLIMLGERFLALVSPKERVLDLGCGAGRDMAWLESQGLRMVGADLSHGMLKEARGIARAPLARMDLRRLGFADRRFGGVWCNAALLHLPKSEAPDALREMRRVLTPDGILLLGLQVGSDEGWETMPHNRVERFFARYTRDEAERMIVQSGFTINHAEIATGGNRTWVQFLAMASTN